MQEDTIYLRCEDHAETLAFSRYRSSDGESDFEINIQDSYCGGDMMGIKGRFKRAWRAFFAKPIYYTGVYIADRERIAAFIDECSALVHEHKK